MNTTPTTPLIETCKVCNETDTLTVLIGYTEISARRMCLHCAKRWADNA